MTRKRIKEILKNIKKKGNEQIKQYLKEIYNCEEEIVKEIIKKRYFEGKTDQEIIMSLPLSESTFYRIKNRLIEKIYYLYILEGYVSKKEILDDSFFD